MTRRFTFLAALALVVSFATGAQAQTSSGFASFSQGVTATSNPISYTRTAGPGGPMPVMLSGSTAGTFSINDLIFLASGPAEYANATLVIDAMSSTAAINPVSGVFVQEGFSGTFSIYSNGTNLLSSSFSYATLSQAGGGAASFTIRDQPYSSDILNPFFDSTFSFTLANAPAFSISNGAFQNFSSNVSGTYAAVIPEPATLAMAGLGIFALPLAVRVARRRRAN